ncbi:MULTISPECIES: SsgA family sporulation/cell division regulator [Streptomyces]|uniref:SsgA family sporulation/cell division regulator n=1 Tax=Streptomyces ardesiacus TaxID=285564 RepID=A0ABW8H3P8_9ACTN|nr:MULTISPECIES: SsgA family sporulation/cell division regulator [Streptomyces]KOT95590.1 cell division protein [Streptomyces sp. NRRL F-4711]KOX38955.1 cell division protein [Streptomyces sp. NRRL F-4707]KOX45064.1 cell division protein [Streptomyces sp. NRRL F-7442]MCL7367553.1 SsgA family sporulation/cell division regulator [Streptomyces ardesiacus]
MSVVEQYARAHILTDADLPDQDDGGAIPVVLRYDPERDPSTVRVALPGRGGRASRSREWTFSRALLEQGLRAPAGEGDVRVWPCGRVQAVIEFHSPQGCSVVQFENKALVRFLRRTHQAVAAQPVAH